MLVAAIEIVLPAAEVPATTTEEPASDSSAGAVTVSGVVALRVPHVAPGRVARAVEDPARGDVAHQADELARRPRQRRGGAGRLAVLEADRRRGRIGAERRAGEVGHLPRLLGDQADARGRAAASPRGAPTAAPTLPRSSSYCPRSPASTGHRWPLPLFDGAHGRPSEARRRSRRRCSGRSRRRCRCCGGSSRRPRRASGRGPGRPRRARRAGRTRGSPASMTSRWSSVGPPLPTLY